MKKILLYIIFAGMIVSCQNFEDLNKDPNRLSKVPYQTLLTPALYALVNNGVAFSITNMNELMEITVNRSTPTGVHRYWINSNSAVSQWTNYFRYAYSMELMYKGAQVAQDSNYMAVALTMKAYSMYFLTMLFGDIPCSQMGMYMEGILQPVFDPQEQVFAQITTWLDEASKMYDPNESLSGNDIMYAGNISKWRKFTNSLQLRVWLNLYNRKPVEAVQKFAEILDNPSEFPVFEDWKDDAALYYLNVEPYFNPYFNSRSFDFSGHKILSSFLVDSMSYYSDIRRNRWMSTSPYYESVPSGFPSSMSGDYASLSNVLSDTLRVSPKLGIMMQSSEVEFIKSELAYRGLWLSGAGQEADFFKNGIRQSCLYWDVRLNEAASSTRLPKDNPTTLARQLSDINTFVDAIPFKAERLYEQKFLGLFMVNIMQWVEYRRTGQPYLYDREVTTNNGLFPVRYMYPIVTRSTNQTNYTVAVSRMRPRAVDDLNQRCWVERND